ncbi:N-acetylneuraminate synthase [Paenibacillus rhizovicinus]|uniref:N-acetylneuraminate synthase n=1 Tax=Paenibacillus rhizovicinus TaxID=2704463 RepID=A0A6C0P238_9BACL|nr:N-acetylneuraminate synthase [Paenibacillus rhizovicinus]QHW32610.1 N-acetylneuraminate synthase [Paenibacillus rhizovicinus]
MKQTLIIAEAGVNHNGEMDLAYRLIDAAVEAGADYVKFQTWKSENVISKHAPKAEYQKETTGEDESMLEMEKKLEFPFENFILLKEYCQKKDIGFMSTPFDIESALFLFSMGVDMVKIPSGEITNLPFLEVIADHACPVILSTGMCEIEEIEDAVRILTSKGNNNLSILHCNTQYPTPMKDVNLRAIQTLEERFKFPIGLSDHSLGIEVPVAAVAMGAEVIEKHFTLSRDMEGPDHKASLEPTELTDMVRSIRNIELALGDTGKHVTESERGNMAVARKSIVASKKISRGEAFTVENITTKRPGTGISPMKWYEVLGGAAKRDFQEDELIEL